MGLVSLDEHCNADVTICIVRLELRDLVITLILNDMNFKKKLTINIGELKII